MHPGLPKGLPYITINDLTALFFTGISKTPETCSSGEGYYSLLKGAIP
jgi:hypothetical protein